MTKILLIQLRKSKKHLKNNSKIYSKIINFRNKNKIPIENNHIYLKK